MRDTRKFSVIKGFQGIYLGLLRRKEHRPVLRGTRLVPKSLVTCGVLVLKYITYEIIAISEGLLGIEQTVSRVRTVIRVIEYEEEVTARGQRRIDGQAKALKIPVLRQE